MTRKLIALAVIPAAAITMTAGQALSGGALSKQKSATTAQKKAIMKAAGLKGPRSCFAVQLSARKTTIAGVKFNERAKRCKRYAFNGASLYYATPNKKAWFKLDSGSSLTASNCSALKTLVGKAAWQDMIPYISTMGCKNFD